MRLLHHDRTTGEYRLRIETPSDLWRLARFVRVGESVGSYTTRRDPEAPQDTPSAQKERRSVWLGVRAEQIEFHGFTHHVRITGPIVAGPFDLGRHHTLDLAEGDEVTILKPNPTSAERSLLEEGTRGHDDPVLIIAAVDWGDSSIVRLRGRSVEPVAELRRALGGKQYSAGTTSTRDRGKYVEELVELLHRTSETAQAVVIAGPGFLKEELAKQLGEKYPALKPKLKLLPTAESGGSGVHELLRSGRASEVLRGSVAAEESNLLERWVTGMAGTRLSAIGLEEVGGALAAGAVETLLVLDTRLTDPALGDLLQTADQQQTHLFIVRDDGATGDRLRALGGVGALLRYPWTRVDRATA
jgi:protein pelota